MAGGIAFHNRADVTSNSRSVARFPISLGMAASAISMDHPEGAVQPCLACNRGRLAIRSLNRSPCTVI